MQRERNEIKFLYPRSIDIGPSERRLTFCGEANDLQIEKLTVITETLLYLDMISLAKTMRNKWVRSV